MVRQEVGQWLGYGMVRQEVGQWLGYGIVPGPVLNAHVCPLHVLKYVLPARPISTSIHVATNTVCRL